MKRTAASGTDWRPKSTTRWKKWKERKKKKSNRKLKIRSRSVQCKEMISPDEDEEQKKWHIFVRNYTFCIDMTAIYLHLIQFLHLFAIAILLANRFHMDYTAIAIVRNRNLIKKMMVVWKTKRNIDEKKYLRSHMFSCFYLESQKCAALAVYSLFFFFKFWLSLI